MKPWKIRYLASGSIRASAALAFGLKGASILLSLFVGVILARLLGAEEFGIYAFALSVATLLSIFSQFGLPNFLTREIAKEEQRGNWRAIRELWRWSNQVALAFSAIAVVLSGIALAVFWGKLPAGQNLALVLGLILVPVLVLSAIRSAALRGLRKVLASVYPESLLRPVLMTSLLAGAYFLLDRNLRGAEAVALNLVSAAIILALLSLLLRKSWPSGTPSSELNGVADRSAWLASARSMALVAAIGQIIKQTDVLMLGLLVAPAEVGLYRVALQGAALIELGQVAAFWVVGPYFARLHAKADTAALQKLARMNAMAVFALATLTYLVFVLFGRQIVVTIMGAEFAGAENYILILGLGQLANAFFASVSFFLSMTGHEKLVSRVLFFVMLFNIALNLSLIPLFGPMGAAAATAISMAIQNIILYRLARRVTGIRTAPW